MCVCVFACVCAFYRNEELHQAMVKVGQLCEELDCVKHHMTKGELPGTTTHDLLLQLYAILNSTPFKIPLLAGKIKMYIVRRSLQIIIFL